ncbi:helix-turn-helix transcriptional regulator [Burkholderia sp. BCC1977]|uniref:helix-turn-helix transcriptional regulator n=1 Tax=Burkholderia sp. BCC1977 TaxID=2817440 RepID=UPI002ABD3E48|nr:helix-turn-helix transcriptional regulator [Burkholderia sp. BCC1977]
MFHLIYFGAVSALVHRHALPDHAARMLAGDFDAALRDAERRAERAGASSTRDGSAHDEGALFGSLSDALLALEFFEDAEESYRREQKARRAQGETVRVASCRNTGWQMLARGRFRTALNCFSQLMLDRDCQPIDRLQGALGAAFAHFHLGQADASRSALEAAESAAAALDPLAQCIVDAAALDIDAQLQIRRADRLRDHAFWQATPLEARVLARREPAECDACASALPDAAQGLRRRLEHVARLIRLAEGKGLPADASAALLVALRPNQSAGTRRMQAIEVALAALAGGVDDLAEHVIAMLHQADEGANQDLDYLFCVAKVRRQQGRADEALSFYHRYALDAMYCLRSEAIAAKPDVRKGGDAAAALNDDVAARLPARYRRAYRYMVEHAHRRDLSIDEIASHIGVTVRALQLAFKAHTGLVPTEVLRRHRMHGIRRDLTGEAAQIGGVLDTANRWGVSSRSALLKSYRRCFDETPTDTQQR